MLYHYQKEPGGDVLPGSALLHFSCEVASYADELFHAKASEAAPLGPVRLALRSRAEAPAVSDRLPHLLGIAQTV